VEQGLELGCHDDVNEEDRQQHGKAETREGGLHLPVLPAQGDEVPGGQGEGLQPLFDLPGDASEIPSLQVCRNYGDTTLAHPTNLARAGNDTHFGQGGEGNEVTGSEFDLQPPEVFETPQVFPVRPHPDVIPGLSLGQLGGDIAQELCLHHLSRDR